MIVKGTVWLIDPNGIDREAAYSIGNPESEMEAYGWYKVQGFEVEVIKPTREMVIPAAVSALRAKQDSLRARAEKEATDIERVISELLAITHEPSRPGANVHGLGPDVGAGRNPYKTNREDFDDSIPF